MTLYLNVEELLDVARHALGMVEPTGRSGVPAQRGGDHAARVADKREPTHDDLRPRDTQDIGVGIRDIGLLESAAARPAATAFGQDAYPDLFTKAAALLDSLANNHALVDGNTRLAWLATYVFAAMNGVQLITDQDSVFDLTMAVASGKMRDVEKIADRLRGWGQPIQP